MLKEVPEGATAVGIPAKNIVKSSFSQIVELKKYNSKKKIYNNMVI